MVVAALFLAAVAALPPPQIGTEVRTASVASLVGQTPAEAAATLGMTAQPAFVPRFAARVGDKTFTLAAADLRGVTGCGGLADLRSADGSTYVEGFLFRDDRIVAVVRPRAFAAQPLSTTMKAVRAETRAARKRPAGPLPLAAGVQPYLDELQGRGFAEGERLRIGCRPRPQPTTRPAARSPAKDVLAAPFVILTLAYWSPVYAAQAVDRAGDRALARENGPVISQIRLGEPPPPGLRERKGVRWHQDAPGYAVVTLNLGKVSESAAPYETFGVRDGRIEWIGQPDRGLCQDAERRATAAREGCTETGDYRP